METNSLISPLQSVLEARDQRASMRNALSGDGLGTVSLSFNIPGWPKQSPLTRRAFAFACDDFLRWLQACRVHVEHFFRGEDGAGDFLLLGLRVTEAEGGGTVLAKEACEAFEERHPLARLLDADVTSPQGWPVPSGKTKDCLLCPGIPAEICRREGRHAFQELRGDVNRRLRDFLAERRRERVCRRLAELALRSCLWEVAHGPKPGLVDRFGPGSHLDMDLFTFLSSSAALAPGLETFARAGYDWPGDRHESQALPFLRDAGLALEEEMLRATGGVNTHRGFIFLAGAALFAAGRVLSGSARLWERPFRGVVRRLLNNLSETDMAGPEGPPPTHGGEAYRRYGAGGARAEAEEGFPTVFTHGLAILERLVPGELPPLGVEFLDRVMEETLLSLLSAGRDTNLLHRGGAGAVGIASRMAEVVLSAKDETERNREREALHDWMAGQRLSPGGTADLLALSLLFHFAFREDFGLPEGGGEDGL